jgi:glutamate 5-kinase
LAALVAVLVRADVLILLSDVDALYTKPPREPGAEKIDYVTFGDDLDSVEFGEIGDAGVGTGGAVTKVAAAHLASASGTAVLITAAELVADALGGARIGTWFEPNPDRAT